MPQLNTAHGSCMRTVWGVAILASSIFFLFFLYKIHISPDTGVNDGVWWWGPLSSADQRSRLHSSMDAPKGYWVGRIKLKKKTEERKWKDCIAQ